METLLTTRSSSARLRAAPDTFGVVARTFGWTALRARVAAFIRKAIEQRRAQRGLAGIEMMSDRELRDIGMRRTDVDFGMRCELRPPLMLAEHALFERDWS
jgi:uncharacterized protein YjiS (DUF1127 family)